MSHVWYWITQTLLHIHVVYRQTHIKFILCFEN